MGSEMCIRDRVNASNVMGNTLLAGASQIVNSYAMYSAMGLFDSPTGTTTGGGSLTKVRDTTNPFANSTRVKPYSWGNAIKGMR